MPLIGSAIVQAGRAAACPFHRNNSPSWSTLILLSVSLLWPARVRASTLWKHAAWVCPSVHPSVRPHCSSKSAISQFRQRSASFDWQLSHWLSDNFNLQLNAICGSAFLLSAHTHTHVHTSIGSSLTAQHVISADLQASDKM